MIDTLEKNGGFTLIELIVALAIALVSTVSVYNFYISQQKSYITQDRVTEMQQSLRVAMEAGFSRAWTSIRDSNLSTLITCAILYWFGSNFGASIVKGFAITLALGVVVNLFTAITVTRTFIRFVFDLAGERLRETGWLLGI